MALAIQALIIDAHDPSALASFWEQALGWRRTYERADEVILEPPEHSLQDGVAADLLFGLSPDGKVGKNRLHLDLRPDDQAAEVERAAGPGREPGRRRPGRRRGQLGGDGRPGGQRVLHPGGVHPEQLEQLAAIRAARRVRAARSLVHPPRKSDDAKGDRSHTSVSEPDCPGQYATVRPCDGSRAGPAEDDVQRGPPHSERRHRTARAWREPGRRSWTRSDRRRVATGSFGSGMPPRPLPAGTGRGR